MYVSGKLEHLVGKRIGLDIFVRGERHEHVGEVKQLDDGSFKVGEAVLDASRELTWLNDNRFELRV